MISSQSALRFSMIACATLAISISGCQLSGLRNPCGQCTCQQYDPNPTPECGCNPTRMGLFPRLRLARGQQRVAGASPYNLPQNFNSELAHQAAPADVDNSTIIVDPATEHLEKLPLEPTHPKEIENAPEANPTSDKVSSRHPRRDASVAKTFSQLKPPAAEPIEHRKQSIVASPNNKSAGGSVLLAPPLDKAKPYYNAPENNVANDKDLTNQPSAFSDITVDESQFRPTPKSHPTAKAGAAFDQLAEEIFQEIDLKEELNIQATPIQRNTVPAKPASTEIESESKPSLKSNEEEVYGAIQFDAVLKHAAAAGLYARQNEKIKLESRDVSNFTPKENLGAEDVDFMIRPLPQVVEQTIEPQSSFEFRTMPAYHMPTLRAVPQTNEREIESSIFRLRFDQTTTLRQASAPSPSHRQTTAAQQQPHESPSNTQPLKLHPLPAPMIRPQEKPVFAPLPVESKPLITPLPQIPTESQDRQEIEHKSESVRGLTNRPTQNNPLR